LLRQVLYDLVEPALVDRPKVGFSVPLGDWLRGPLRGWAENIILGKSEESDRFLQLASLRPIWDRLKSGDDEPALALWAVLMFESWRRRWLN
jgi:asparagine synthase (glutamine-hydrolysing)